MVLAPELAAASLLSMDPMFPRPFRVAKKYQETDDTFTMELSPVDGTYPCRFAPGQFNMIYAFGVGEIPLSISGHPRESEGWVHTTRVVGTVTREIGCLGVGDRIGVRGPFGSSWPLNEAKGRDLVLVAGGMGMAPLRPVLFEVCERRNDFQRVVILYGTRTPGDILFQKQLEDWASRNQGDLFMTVDRSTLDWKGHVGVVTALISGVPFASRKAVVFTCGPEVMMRLVINEIVRRGVSPSRIFLSMERNMKCAVGFCGRCQYGPTFICKDGPVFRYDRIRDLFHLWEI